MEIQRLEYRLSVCKVENVPETLLKDELCFIGKTDEELSLVCMTEHVPEYCIAREDGWMVFRIKGILDFSLVGILAPIATILAERQIGIFAISTYNTDYVMVKEQHYEAAMTALKENGYTVQ